MSLARYDITVRQTAMKALSELTMLGPRLAKNLVTEVAEEKAQLHGGVWGVFNPEARARYEWLADAVVEVLAREFGIKPTHHHLLNRRWDEATLSVVTQPPFYRETHKCDALYGENLPPLIPDPEDFGTPGDDSAYQDEPPLED